LQVRAPIFHRAQKTQFFQAPVFVVGDDQGGDGSPHLFPVVEYAALDGLFFKGPEETFHHTISLWFRDEGETWGYPPKTVLLEKMVGKILRAVIQAQGQPSGHIRPHAAENFRQPQGYGLQCCEAIAGLGYVPANALGVPMFHGAEEPDPAVLSRQDAGAVRAPPDIGGVGNEVSLRELGFVLAATIRGEQLMLPQDTPQPLPVHPDTVQDPEPGPHFPVTFTLKGRTF